MTNTFENYTLLAGSHGRRGSLWKGPDHLLVIEGSGVLFALSEQYRRIDYANIQSLGLVRTVRYGWLIAAFAVPAVLFAIGLIATLDQAIGFPIAFGVPFTVFLTLLIIHLVKGRTVRCSVQTAVQVLRLRPLTRETRAQRVLEELAQLCRHHQGDAPARDAGALPQDSGAPLPPLTGKPIWRGSPAVLIAGATVLLWGLALMGELFIGSMGYLALNASLCTVAGAASVIGVVVAMRHHSPGGLLASLWISLILTMLTGFMALVAIGVAGARLDHMGGNASPFDALGFLAQLSMADTHGFGWLLVGFGALVALLGTVILVHGPRRGPVAAPAPPSVAPPL